MNIYKENIEKIVNENRHDLSTVIEGVVSFIERNPFIHSRDMINEIRKLSTVEEVEQYMKGMLIGLEQFIVNGIHAIHKTLH